MDITFGLSLGPFNSRTSFWKLQWNFGHCCFNVSYFIKECGQVVFSMLHPCTRLFSAPTWNCNHQLSPWRFYQVLCVASITKLSLLLCFYLFVCWERVSLCRPGWDYRCDRDQCLSFSCFFFPLGFDGKHDRQTDRQIIYTHLHTNHVGKQFFLLFATSFRFAHQHGRESILARSEFTENTSLCCCLWVRHVLQTY